MISNDENLFKTQLLILNKEIKNLQNELKNIKNTLETIKYYFLIFIDKLNLNQEKKQYLGILLKEFNLSDKEIQNQLMKF